MVFSSTSGADTPFGEMNTTPLIDVMLVLLVMFIITIPVATHSVDIDLPSGQPLSDDTILNPLRNKLVLSEQGQLLWNGAPVDRAQLVEILAETRRRYSPEPELQFEPEAGAPYAEAALTLRTIRFSGVTNFGFVGNERYREFAAR